MRCLPVLLVYLLSVPAGIAQCPTVTRRLVPATYVTPVGPVAVEVPVYVPILVPSYSFQFLPAVAPAVQVTPTPGQPPAPTPQEFWPRVPVVSASNFQSVVSLLTNKCARCHTSPARAGIDLFGGDGHLLSSVNRAEVYRVVSQQLMPPAARRDPSQALSAQEVTQVQNWLRQP